jgi:hypothetical protein
MDLRKVMTIPGINFMGLKARLPVRLSKPRWVLAWLALLPGALGFSTLPAPAQCGGVIRLFYNLTSSNSVFVQVIFTNVVPAGAGWRFSNCTNSPNCFFPNNLVVPVPTTNLNIEFADVPGWDPPAIRAVLLTNGINRIADRYLIPSRLGVFPTAGLSSTGYTGGPFSPANIPYTLSNTGESCVVHWWITKAADWLSLSSTNGDLFPWASTNVVVSVNSNADGLAPGNYTGGLAFSFTNSNNSMGRIAVSVSLNVTAIRLSGARLLSDRSITMTLDAATNRMYSIVVSSNVLTPITNWTALLTNIPGKTTFTNQPPSSTRQRYYRAKKP